MNTATQKKYDHINRVAPHTVLSSTYTSVAYGIVRQSITVKREAREYRTGNHLYGVYLHSENPYDTERASDYVTGNQVAAVVHEYTQAMNVIPQEARTLRSVADMEAHFGIY